MKAKTSNLKPNRAVFIGALTLLLALGIILFLPQSRAWANSIVQFFTQAQSNTFTLPSENTELKVTATPTVAVPAFAGCEDQATSLTYYCAVRSAEAALGFDILELPSDPEGFTFANVVTNPDQNLISIIYTRDGGELTVLEINGTPVESLWGTTWDAVPTDAVEQVQINRFEGEYVRGMFVVKSPTGTKASWEPDAPIQRLRWREANMWFEITMNGLPGDDELIGKDWLISLAESLK